MKTILVVDDEDALRRMLCRALRQDGFQVYDANSGEAALKIATKRGAELDLLLTDIRMPGMSGHELATILSKTLPHLNVLFITGYSDATLPPKFPVLRKPFRLEQLRREVMRAVGSQTSQSASS